MYHMMTNFQQLLDLVERQAQPPRVFVEQLQTGRQTPAGIIALTSAIVLTWRREDVITVLRLVVERANVIDATDGLAQRLARSNAAAALVSARLADAGAEVEYGILLERGMYDDLQHFDGDQALWTIKGGRLLPRDTPPA